MKLGCADDTGSLVQTVGIETVVLALVDVAGTFQQQHVGVSGGGSMLIQMPVGAKYGAPHLPQ